MSDINAVKDAAADWRDGITGFLPGGGWTRAVLCRGLTAIWRYPVHIV